MDVDFFEPGVFDDENGDPVPALVTGFGAIFTDVDLPESTKLELFDQNDNLLFSQFVEPDPQGLSFLGVAFEQPVVSKVRITSGNVPLSRGLDDDPFGTGGMWWQWIILSTESQLLPNSSDSRLNGIHPGQG